jgi:aryl-alcohol dehydrogenase-like predicted oxidoreductase
VIERIGLGLAATGRPAYINLGRAGELPAERDVAAMRAASHEVLDAAYAAGVRRVDVARSYGRAEEFLADWLDDRGHRDLTVSSKWGYAYVGGWRMDAAVHEAKEHSLARFRAQWAESRALLGDAISLYQVHSLTEDSPLFGDQPLLDALAGLATEGIRVGFSTSGPGQPVTIRRALALEREGRPVFTAVQSTWNLLEPSAGAALAEAHAAGRTVLVKETLANGRLVVDPPPALARIAAAHGTGPDAVALAAVLAQPWADVVLTGPSGARQLTANLAATTTRLAPGELTSLAALAELPGDYWHRRSALAWQ